MEVFRADQGGRGSGRGRGGGGVAGGRSLRCHWRAWVRRHVCGGVRRRRRRVTLSEGGYGTGGDSGLWNGGSGRGGSSSCGPLQNLL